MALGLAALLLEALLQGAALVAALVVDGATPRPDERAAVRILLVGDSHAAGAGVPAEENLAGHLERLLAVRHPRGAFRVINLGRAGVNSAYVANRLDANLLAHRPQLVIVWVGVNDLWNALETEAWAEGGLGTRLRRFLLHSKLYRLASVLWYTRKVGDAAEPDRRATGWLPDEEIARGLGFDLARMARAAFAVRTPILFVNYPVPYRVVNGTIRRTGERIGVPVIQSAADLLRAQADGHALGALITLAAGPHPTGLLYRYVAESALPHVEMSLRQAGVDLPRADRDSSGRHRQLPDSA